MMTLSLFIWGLVNYLLMTVLLLLIQPRLKTSPNYKILNEFLCTFVLVVYSLELRTIGQFAGAASLTVLFVRLSFGPYLNNGAYVSAAEAFYYCLQKGVKKRNVVQLLAYIGMEIMAIIAGILFCTLMWNALGSTISESHREFLEAEFGYLLNAPPLEGFLTEVSLTTLCLLPRLFIKPSFFLNLVQAAVITVFVANFSSFFGNPIIATAFILLWHRQDPAGYYAYFLIYWIGNILTYVIVLSVANQLQRSRATEHTE